MVLAFIVLLTILIVSFISFNRLNGLSTASYSKSIQAQEIAQGGIEDILGDLHQEIIAGSTLQNGGSSAYGPVYIPVTNWTAQPARLGYNPAYYGLDVTSTNLPPSLLRVSRASQDNTPTDFYPPLSTICYPGTLPQNRASAANSSTNSITGHYISAARWNKIALLSTNSVIPPAFSTNTPDWVMVTRGGSRICSASDLTSSTTNIKPSASLTTTTSVVGRYAYAVYDEGALLDVNAAGYVSSATNSFASASPTTIYTNSTTGVSQVLTSKTYSSYSDLTQLPGLTGCQNVVDNLVEWRNASVTMTGSSGGVNFYQAAFTSAKTGFKTFASGDSPLLSRQDLINYFAQIDPARNSYSAALPFLGTFSRAANAPSWYPTLDSSSLPGYVGGAYNGIAPVAYKSNAESTTTTLFAEPNPTGVPSAANFPNPNRDVPNVRYTQAGTITHYADDGTQTTYTVKAGDPMIQHRFSLAKLSWLTYQGPSASHGGNPGGTAANILACFGLQWTTNPEGYSCWQYTAGKQEGSPPQLSIETLDEVAADLREPNFFEMLKAGILAGSIGQMPGPLINGESSGGVWNTGGPVEGVIGSGFVTYSGIRDRHILQIGANLIDQADTDSYPTDIYMTFITGVSQELDLSINNVYGDENLPLISRMIPLVVAVPSESYKLWFQPEIWNPHQAVGIGTAQPATVPTNFRAHAYGTVVFTVKDSYFADSVTDAPLYYDSDAGRSFPYTNMNGSLVSTQGSDLAVANFSDTHTGSLASPFYSNPIRLDQKSAINGALVPNTLTFPLSTAAVNYWGVLGNVTKLPADYTGSGNSATVSGTLQVDSSENFAAIFGGECDGIDLTNPNYWSTRNTLYCLVAPNPSITFSLDYADASGVWHPYSFMTNIKDQEVLVNVFEAYNSDGTHSNYNTSANTPTEGTTIYATTPTFTHVDPRTDRFSSEETAAGGNGRWNMDCTVDPGPDNESWPNNTLGSQNRIQGTQQTFPYRSYGFVFYPTAPASFTWESNNLWLGFWPVNQVGSPAANAYYVDPDGVVRPADSYRRNPATMNLSNPNSPSYTGNTTGDGSLAWNAAYATTVPAAPTNLAAATSATNLGSAQARRPVILNRPFRSVAEMGYAFRDVPFKTVDFFSSSSGDAGLLDLFSVADEPAVSAGQVNVSNAPTSVLKAVLNGVCKMEINNPVSDTTGFPNFLTPADAAAASSAIGTYVNQNGPLANRADLVTRLSNPIFTSLYSISVGSGSVAGCANYANKAYAEAPVRALSDFSNTRSWNLLIDIIAQSGFMAPSAASLNDFVVTGERRYWLHVSIDRLTGKIIDQQLEPVYE